MKRKRTYELPPEAKIGLGNYTSNRDSYLPKKDPEVDVLITLNDPDEEEQSPERTSREITLFDANSRQFGGSYIDRATTNNMDGGGS